MSQYKISKARLAQIIKEEYRSLHEVSSSKAIEDDYGRGIGGGLEDQISAVLDHVSSDQGANMDALSYFIKQGYEKRIPNTDLTYSPAAARWLDERGLLGGHGASAGNRTDEDKKVKKESLDSIRDLIQQELQNL